MPRPCFSVPLRQIGLALNPVTEVRRVLDARVARHRHALKSEAAAAEFAARERLLPEEIEDDLLHSVRPKEPDIFLACVTAFMNCYVERAARAPRPRTAASLRATADFYAAVLRRTRTAVARWRRTGHARDHARAIVHARDLDDAMRLLSGSGPGSQYDLSVAMIRLGVNRDEWLLAAQRLVAWLGHVSPDRGEDDTVWAQLQAPLIRTETACRQVATEAGKIESRPRYGLLPLCILIRELAYIAARQADTPMRDPQMIEFVDAALDALHPEVTPSPALIRREVKASRQPATPSVIRIAGVVLRGVPLDKIIAKDAGLKRTEATTDSHAPGGPTDGLQTQRRHREG